MKRTQRDEHGEPEDKSYIVPQSLHP